MIGKLKTAIGLLSGALGRFTPFLSPFWDDSERQAVDAWLNGKAFPDAPAKLTQAIKAQLGTEWTVMPLNLGRSAIQAALEAMSLPPGSEVILPAFACNGVALPIVQSGYRPVFADVDAEFNLSYQSVLEADSPLVRALILPHMSGCLARDADKIVEWAGKRGVFVIEDAAQSLGLRHGGRPTGTLGDVGIFSCHGGKQILGPGGGWVITRNPLIAKKLLSVPRPLESRHEVEKRVRRFVSDYTTGIRERGRRHLVEVLQAMLPASRNTLEPNVNPARQTGFELYSISDIEAQLILLQLPKVGEINRIRSRNASAWMELLSKAQTMALSTLPESDNVWTKMLLSFPGSPGAHEIRALTAALGRFGVECESSYQPLYLRPQYATCRRTSMGETESRWRGALAVPVRPNLNDGDWRRIRFAVSVFAKSLPARKGFQ